MLLSQAYYSVLLVLFWKISSVFASGAGGNAMLLSQEYSSVLLVLLSEICNMQNLYGGYVTMTRGFVYYSAWIKLSLGTSWFKFGQTILLWVFQY